MLVASIPTSEYGQINGLVMNGSTIYWWFELIASLICSSRRGEVPLEVGLSFFKCYPSVISYLEAMGKFCFRLCTLHEGRASIDRRCIMARLIDAAMRPVL